MYYTCNDKDAMDFFSFSERKAGDNGDFRYNACVD